LLTINTTKASSAAHHNPFRRLLTLGGSGTLAALFLFCLPVRRRRWQAPIGLLLFVAVVVAAGGCANTSIKTGPPTGGTTAGTYTVTVTGSSGTVKATTAVTLTVE
jgi:hypothetical protein